VKRLWFQQTLAFSLVVIIAMGVVVIWINQSADKEFRKCVPLDMKRVPGTGLQELVEYYPHRGSWEGVENLLAKSVSFDDDRSLVLGTALADGERQSLKDNKRLPDVLLVDASGRVVFDSEGKDTGKLLTRKELTNAWPIKETDDGDIIGQLLLFYSYTEPLDEPAQRFLDRVENLLLVNATLAVGFIIVVGALLSRRLSAPLGRLADAARAVAAGDLDQRVDAGGSTEVAQVSQAFNEMTAALNEAETLRQNMVADVAHELRNPLSVLQGNLWAILNDAYPLEKAEISRLYDETRLLSRLVEDLRELALADAGQLHLNLHTIDVAQVIRHTVDGFSLAAEAQEVNLTVQLPYDLPFALADPDRVAQVLRNLLINAVRHTPTGGAITVSVSSKAQSLEIAVADTGEGIAPEDLAHIFERFWRADPARARSGTGGEERSMRGTGLGLAVAQGLVGAQGGRIWAESTPGAGTVFRLTLPLDRRDHREM
jgi:two-component system OmpR family sensor kinase/two-component system sensor histidine kinase BaeS